MRPRLRIPNPEQEPDVVSWIPVHYVCIGMVYYGKISLGCQRCRQRKVKCDQRKPGCVKCERSATECPGYRNLTEILFRDESERIIRKAHRKHHRLNIPASHLRALTLSENHKTFIFAPLSLSISDLGASFFFTKYLPRETVVSKNFHDWLSGVYASKDSNYALYAIIQAVGIAGLFNVSPSQVKAVESQKLYSQAVSALQRLFDDPIHATSDATLTTVILLALYETVTFQTREDQGSLPLTSTSLTHIEGAIAILESRGQEQFTYERGGHLLGQVSTRMLPMCLHHGIAVPPALVQATYNFHTSPLWSHRSSHPGSLTEIAFRLVNLHAAIKSGYMTQSLIRSVALEIDHDLELWREGVPPEWRYTIVHNKGDRNINTCLDGKYHIYASHRIAETWNSWRSQRIAINQILVQNELLSGPGTASVPAILAIRRFSEDICLSIGYLVDSPRSFSLVQPLYVISIEELNSSELRRLAISELRRMSTSMGIRQAGLLAENSSKRIGLLDHDSGNYCSRSTDK
ncbi:hypothetical protein N7451_003244 [Penicillium sp. IBT 35674x]|nr:hypothetical protein N7451_003244 [Penicillium sp. IBT 35674x]